MSTPDACKTLSTSDWAVLARLAEKPTHGFKLALVFSKGGELGGIWTVQRPQVYRALERLAQQGLVVSVRQEAGENGPPRTLYAPTRAGEGALNGWLHAPVQHLREGRSDLLLKLAFLERRGLDPTPLLRSQHAVFSEVRRRYGARLREATGAERTALEWRSEVAGAALNFLESRLGRPS